MIIKLVLYIIYITLTFIEWILLLIGGISPFDSLLISFGTAGTGGFSVLNSSIASYSVFSKYVIKSIYFNIHFFCIVYMY